jgi:hypothetical protein
MTAKTASLRAGCLLCLESIMDIASARPHLSARGLAHSKIRMPGPSRSVLDCGSLLPLSDAEVGFATGVR